MRQSATTGPQVMSNALPLALATSQEVESSVNRSGDTSTGPVPAFAHSRFNSLVFR